jgi:hypothetical protein
MGTGSRTAFNRPFAWGETIARDNANSYASQAPFEAAADKQGDSTPVGFCGGRMYNGYRTQDTQRRLTRLLQPQCGLPVCALTSVAR